MRSWRIARRTDLNFADLADWVNPVVRGWMNYYGPSAVANSNARTPDALLERPEPWNAPAN